MRILARLGILAVCVGILAACKLELATPVPARTGEEPATATATERAVDTTLPATETATARVLATSTLSPVSLTVTANQTLNVRQYPGLDERIVGILYAGDEVTTTGRECTKTGWVEINYPSLHWDTGWVESSFMSPGACD